MLSRFLALFGLKSAPKAQPGVRPRSRPGSATAHLFEKRPSKPEASRPSGITVESDFNPYNTGKFDRSASWDRISKSQR